MKFCSLFILCFLSFGAIAQDPHFSQFFASPLTLNPAFTGKFNGTYRVAANHRNQWPTINNAFITSTGSVDVHLLPNKLPTNDMFGIGFMALNDNSANAAVQMNYFSLSTAYHKGLDEDGYHQLSLGVQTTYANMFINTSALKFEDQLTTNGFTGVTGEIFNNATLQGNYFDLNAGVLYSGSTTDKNNFYAGVSMYHINRPRQSFTGANFTLNPRVTLHGGGFFMLSDGFGVHVSGLHSRQGGASETVVGGAMQIVANPLAPSPISIYAGSWLRLNDALIPYFGMEYNNFRLGLSYDVNTSSLKTASQRNGGFELSLIYTHMPNTDRPIICPKF